MPKNPDAGQPAHMRPLRGVLGVKFERVIRFHQYPAFVEKFVRLPAKVIRGGRQLTVRLLSWTESLDAFNRWLSVALE